MRLGDYATAVCKSKQSMKPASLRGCLHVQFLHNCCATVGTRRLTASATKWLRARTRQRRSDRQPPTLMANSHQRRRWNSAVEVESRQCRRCELAIRR